MLYCHQPLVQIDEAKFGPDAKEFNPRRFVGNQGLKKDVSAYLVPMSCPAVSLLVLSVLVDVVVDSSGGIVGGLLVS